MKTFKNIYPQICDNENIWLAYRRARRGKRLKKRPPRMGGGKQPVA